MESTEYAKYQLRLNEIFNFPEGTDPLIELKKRLSSGVAPPLYPKDYYYFLTLTSTTKSPKMVLRTHAKLAEQENIVSSCLELTKSELPHIHLVMKTNKAYNKSNIQRYNGAHIDCKKLGTATYLKNVLNYIQKEVTKPSQEWLDKNKIEDSILITEDPRNS